jgi:hypothetical protein
VTVELPIDDSFRHEAGECPPLYIAGSATQPREEGLHPPTALLQPGRTDYCFGKGGSGG